MEQEFDFMKYVTKVIFNNKNDKETQLDIILRALNHFGFVSYDIEKYEYVPNINISWDNGDFYGNKN